VLPNKEFDFGIWERGVNRGDRWQRHYAVADATRLDNRDAT
jgi:hypothetical protein